MVSVHATAGQDAEGGIQLSEIAAGAGGYDEQLGPSLWVQPPNVSVVEQTQRLLRSPECALTIRDHRQVSGIPGNPPRRTQLSQCLGPFLAVISRDANRFSHSADPGSAPPSRPRMR